MAKNTCSARGCPRPVHAHGLCRTHYDRQKKSRRGIADRLAASPKCSVPVCQRPAYAQGLCQMHYEARRKGLGGRGTSSSPRRTCSIPDCSAPHHAKGYCKKHYGMLLRRKGGAGDAGHAGLCEIAGCNRVATKNRRCDEHQGATTVDGKRLLTRAERLLEIHKRHELMRKEIEHIKESLAKEREEGEED